MNMKCSICYDELISRRAPENICLQEFWGRGKANRCNEKIQINLCFRMSQILL